MMFEPPPPHQLCLVDALLPSLADPTYVTRSMRQSEVIRAIHQEGRIYFLHGLPTGPELEPVPAARGHKQREGIRNAVRS